MPSLFRQNSDEDSGRSGRDSPKRVKRLRSRMVSFIPAQIDELCGTIPPHQKQSASRLLWADVRVLLQNADCLWAMIRSQCTRKTLDVYFGNTADARDTLLQFGLASVQILTAAMAIPLFIFLPGLLFASFLGTCWLITAAMSWSLSGPTVLMSDRERVTVTDDYSDERWIYVNGMLCSNRSLRNQCTRLSRTFGRPVTGVHNRTLGVVWDLLIVLFQRCLNAPTPCTLVLASQVRDACLTNSVRKVIVVAHSTGALHVSIALDQLHASLPVDALSKLEIYTFGSAASYLSNPCLRIDNLQGQNSTGILNCSRPDGGVPSPPKTTPPSPSQRSEDSERVISHIEHYALASDIFARCGILHNTRNALDNLFCGRVFVLDDMKMSRIMDPTGRSTGGGSLMNENYLDLLFPAGTRRPGFALDQIVKVDVETAEKREFTAQGVALPQKSINPTSQRNSGEFILRSRFSSDSSPDVSPKSRGRSTPTKSGDRAEKRARWETATVVGPGGVGRARVGAKEYEGRSVRQLSRLWRYANGGKPLGPGVPLINGGGNAGTNPNGGGGKGMGGR